MKIAKEYIDTPDEEFTYKLVRTINRKKYTVKILEMTSLKWRTSQEVDKPFWKHRLILIEPKAATVSDCLFFISGNANNFMHVMPDLVLMALSTESPIAIILAVPNLNLHFADEPDPRYYKRGRSEDHLLAYGCDKYMKTGDPMWLPHLPMTKAVVRGMDVLQAVASRSILHFILCGGSKRGWTAWTVTALDDRVRGVIPLLLDLQPLSTSILNHFKRYGTWTPLLYEYVDLAVTSRADIPEFADMLQIIGLEQFTPHITVPKLILLAAGDELWLPDASAHYMPTLQGSSYLRQMPNIDHRLSRGDCRQSVIAFYASLIYHHPLPHMSWSLLDPTTLEVTLDTLPLSATLWHAHNAKACDFRFSATRKHWKGTKLRPDTTITAAIDPPKSGFSAFYVEVTLPRPGPLPHVFTTDIFLTPNQSN